MNPIDQNYHRVVESYKRFSSAPGHREAQKELFSTLASWVKAPPSIAFDRDVFYVKAQEIAQGMGPSSFHRLKPAAREYCDQFNEVRLSIPKLSPSQLNRKVIDLKETHWRFTTQFVREIETVKADTDMVVCIKYPQTLTLFINAIFPNILELKQLIDTCDQEFMTMVPNLAVEKLLADDEISPPELFRNVRGLIDKERPIYKNLGAQEKEILHQKLMGNDVALKQDTLPIFRSIGIISSQLVRETTNPMIRVTLKELEKAFRLIENLPKKVIETDKEAAKALIWSYLDNEKLSENDLPEALFHDEYNQPLRILKARGPDDEQIEALSELIAKEPKAKPWLELIRLASF